MPVNTFGKSSRSLTNSRLFQNNEILTGLGLNSGKNFYSRYKIFTSVMIFSREYNLITFTCLNNLKRPCVYVKSINCRKYLSNKS